MQGYRSFADVRCGRLCRRGEERNRGDDGFEEKLSAALRAATKPRFREKLKEGM